MKEKMMMKRCIFYLSLILSMGGSMFSSCSDEPNDDEKTGPNPPGGVGNLVISVDPDNIIQTRAGGESVGIPEESRVTAIRFILYNAATGAAVLIDESRIGEGGQITNSAVYPSSRTIVGGLSIIEESGAKKYVKEFVDIDKQDYDLLVILNPQAGENNWGLSYLYTGGVPGENSLNEVSREAHNKSLFSQAYNMGTDYGMPDSYTERYYELIVGYILTGIPLNYDASNAYDYNENSYDGEPFYKQMHMPMLNADGFIRVTQDYILPSLEDAKLNPVTVRVERMAAKVAVFDGTVDGSLPSGGFIAGDLHWACDILNYMVYPVRQKAPVAPSAGGGDEQLSTPRNVRYAQDPNYNDVSHERENGSPASAPDDHFFKISGYTPGGTPDLLFRTWNAAGTSSDATTWTDWEYVPENTMAAEEQYEDVTTRVVIRCNYLPPALKVPGMPVGDDEIVVREGEGYYSYKGKILTLDQLTYLVSGTPEEQEEKAALLAGGFPQFYDFYANVMSQLDFISTFIPGGTAEPAKSVSKYGFNFHKNGENYYSVLIRHFNNTESGAHMGYGRYGVVRNNVYRINITNIKGPGSVTIPEPQGPDDKDELVEVKFLVAPWTVKELNFDF